MFIKQPRVDFVELQLDDIVTSSPGSSIGICQKGGDDFIDCTGTGYDFNIYGSQDCNGNLDEFD